MSAFRGPSNRNRKPASTLAAGRSLRPAFRKRRLRRDISRIERYPDDASAGRRSIAPCRSVRCPTRVPRETWRRHGSLPDREIPACGVNSHWKSTRSGLRAATGRAWLVRNASSGACCVGCRVSHCPYRRPASPYIRRSRACRRRRRCRTSFARHGSPDRPRRSRG